MDGPLDVEVGNGLEERLGRRLDEFGEDGREMRVRVSQQRLGEISPDEASGDGPLVRVAVAVGEEVV